MRGDRHLPSSRNIARRLSNPARDLPAPAPREPVVKRYGAKARYRETKYERERRERRERRESA